jgi:hypothetical protein
LRHNAFSLQASTSWLLCGHLRLGRCLFRLWLAAKDFALHHTRAIMNCQSKNVICKRVFIGRVSSLNCKTWISPLNVTHTCAYFHDHYRELRLELNISERSAWDLTYPTFFPSPPEGLRSQGEAVWYFYLAEIALRRLGNRILNYVYQDSSTTSQPRVNQVTSNFEDQAGGWYDKFSYIIR